MCTDSNLTPPADMDIGDPIQTPSPTPYTGSKYRPNADPYYVGAKHGGRMEGADNMAKLYRAMWDDYKARFKPVEEMLVSRANNERFREEQVDKAGTTVEGAMDRAYDESRRSLSRRGVRPTGDLAKAMQRSHELRKAGASTDAKNATRVALEDQKMGLMTGGLSRISEQKRGG